MIEITNEDNMALMSRYSDNHFDLAIVDPPYGIGISGTTNTQGKNRRKRKEPKYKKKNWDNSTPDINYWSEIRRVSVNQIVFGANYFIEHLNSSKGWIFWNKKNGCPSFSDGEIIYTSFNRVAKMFTVSSVVETNGGINRIHPTQKPIKLYSWLLQNYAQKGFKILDTHIGSASIAIAVDNANKMDKMQLELTGCELDPDYYKAAMKRIETETNWQSLF